MITLEDISIEVGCSVNTVSKALNNKPDVSVATRQKVIAAAKRLGYVPNVLAKSLVTKITGTIGVVLPSVRNPIYTELIETITLAAAQMNYSTFLAVSNYDPEKEQSAVENFYQKRVDGLIVVPVSDNPSYHELLRRFHIPVVYMLDGIKDQDSYSIGIDNKECAYLATSHLLKVGCEKILLACLHGPERIVYRCIVSGYQEALRQKRIPVSPDQILLLSDAHADSLATGESKAMELLEKCDGVVLENDMLFFDLYGMILESGRSCPGDIAIAACIGTNPDKLRRFSLSANYFNLLQLGQDVFSALMDLIRYPKGEVDVNKIIIRPILSLQ